MSVSGSTPTATSPSPNDSHESHFEWRRFTLTLAAPAVCFAAAQGATVPVLPVVATGLGAGLAAAGLISAVQVIGHLVGNLPTGALIDRLGERRAMLVAAAVSALGQLVCLLAADAWMLAVGAFVSGLAGATFQIARQALVTIMVPVSHRGRLLSSLAGANRLGLLVGPFLATGAIAAAGNPKAVFVAALCLLALGAVAVQWLPDPDRDGALPGALSGGPSGGSSGRGAGAPRATVLETVRGNRGVLLRLGPVIMVVLAMRQGRTALIPLFGVWLGLPPGDIALVVGVAAALDFALFYPGGVLMDRFGRAKVGVPSLLIFAGGWTVLGVTGLLAQPGAPGAVGAAGASGSTGPAWYVTAALLVAMGNGISSGLVATMGADVADPRRPATFLAVWQLTSNLGSVATPVLVSGVTAVASLAAASLTLGTFGVAGAVLTAVFVPRYAPTRAPTRRSPVPAGSPAPR